MIPILSIADLVLIVTKHTDLQSIITFMLQKISTHIVHITNGMASNVVYYKRECRPWQVSFLRCHQMGKTRRIAVAPIRTFASPTPWPPTTPMRQQQPSSSSGAFSVGRASWLSSHFFFIFDEGEERRFLNFKKCVFSPNLSVFAVSICQR